MFVFCLKLDVQESGQGMAFLYFTRNGGLAYNIRVEAEDEVIIKDNDDNGVKDHHNPH